MPKLPQEGERSEIPNQYVTIGAAGHDGSDGSANIDAGHLAALVSAQCRLKLNILSVVSPHADGRIDTTSDEPKPVKGGLGHIDRSSMHTIMDAQHSIDLTMASRGHGHVNTHPVVGPAISVILFGRKDESTLLSNSNKLSLNKTHIADRRIHLTDHTDAARVKHRGT